MIEEAPQYHQQILDLIAHLCVRAACEVDVDGGGTLDFPEFLLMMCDKMAGAGCLSYLRRAS